MKNSTIGYILAGTAVTGLGIYYLIISSKPKNVVQPIVPMSLPNTPVPSKSVTPTVKVTTPRPTGFVTPAPVATGPTIGQKLYASSTGANSYKSASASATNIDAYYHPGDYIGTFLAKDGVYTKVIVAGGLLSGSRTVWVLSTNLKF